MYKEVLPNIFMIQVPLPNNPLGHLNSYLINSDEKKVLIDTGLNFKQSFQSLCEDLNAIGIKLEEITDILLTHFHADHVGLLPHLRIKSKHAKILIHQAEVELSKLILGGDRNFNERIESLFKANGVPTSLIYNVGKSHPALSSQQAYEEIVKSAIGLQEGHKIEVGDYEFKVIWTPGHSPGHICLYEPRMKILLAGDHILPRITPHISKFMENSSPLTDYIKSLRKVEALDIKLVLPAHEDIFIGYHERIAELMLHHMQRLNEIVEKLKEKPKTAFELASEIKWFVKYPRWDEFPPFQKYLAIGECLSHLDFLERQGFITKISAGSINLYSLSNKPVK